MERRKAETEELRVSDTARIVLDAQAVSEGEDWTCWVWRTDVPQVSSGSVWIKGLRLSQSVQ